MSTTTQVNNIVETLSHMDASVDPDDIIDELAEAVDDDADGELFDCLEDLIYILTITRDMLSN